MPARAGDTLKTLNIYTDTLTHLLYSQTLNLKLDSGMVYPNWLKIELPETSQVFTGTVEIPFYFNNLWDLCSTKECFQSGSSLGKYDVDNQWHSVCDPPIKIIVENSMPGVLGYYPLSEGNRWIYKGSYNDWMFPSYITVVREIAGTELKNNGKLYFKIIESGKFDNIYYERIDSLTEKIYRFDSDSIENNFEYLIEDLKEEPGDTIYSYRYKGDGLPFFESLVDTVLFNHPTKIRTYKSGELLNWNYSLAQNFGIIYVGSG